MDILCLHIVLMKLDISIFLSSVNYYIILSILYIFLLFSKLLSIFIKLI